MSLKLFIFSNRRCTGSTSQDYKPRKGFAGSKIGVPTKGKGSLAKYCQHAASRACRRYLYLTWWRCTACSGLCSDGERGSRGKPCLVAIKITAKDETDKTPVEGVMIEPGKEIDDLQPRRSSLGTNRSIPKHGNVLIHLVRSFASFAIMR